MKKTSIEEVDEIFLEKRYLRKSNYINSKEKMEVQDLDGYKYYLSLSDVKDDRNKGNSKYASYNPHTIHNIRHFIESNKLSCKILSEEYKTFSRDKLTFLCECGNEYRTTLNHFFSLNQHVCKKCSRDIVHKNKRISMDKIIELCEKVGLTPLFEYENFNSCSEPYPFLDNSGYKGITRIDTIKTGESFMPFWNKNPFFFENVEKYIESNKLNSKLIVSKSTSSKNMCLECSCGEEFYCTWESFSTNNRERCPKCSKSQSSISLKTEKWLIENGIKYEKEFRISECRNKRALPFDFKVDIDDKEFMLIEVDGGYHMNNPRGENLLEEQKFRDKIKDDFCKENDIHLLRIPHWFYRNKRYEDILRDNILGKS